MKTNALTKISLGVAGLVAGVVLASTIGAQAATTTSPTPNSSPNSSSAPDAHPGDNGSDGVPEAQEHHGGHGRGGHMNLAGTVTAVGATSVTIRTASDTTEYAVTSASDLDKNGEATLNDLTVGDAVTFSVDSTNTRQIDKLHAGDETKNQPAAPNSTPGTASTPGA